jgi:hypothetical protein
MGAAADKIDRQIKETREHMDKNLGTLERRAASNAVRYGRIAVVALGVVAVGGTGVLIYRWRRRPSRTEQVRSMVLEILKDLPDSLRDLPGEVTARLKRPLPSIKVVVNGEEEEREPRKFEGIVRKVRPALVSASGALIERFSRHADRHDHQRSAVPAYD